MGKAGGRSTTPILYSRLVKFKIDDILGGALGLNEDQLANLFQKTFIPGYLGNY